MFSSIASTAGVRRRRLIAAAVSTLLVLAVVVMCSMLQAGHDTAEPAEISSAAQSTPGADVEDPVGSSSLADRTAIPSDTDPETFARQVAEALFAWDTASLTTPTELTERLVAVADPTGESSAGLVADVANYLPTPQAWVDLRRYETRQWIEISSSTVPELWATATQQAGPDGLLPGTTAYTIRGVRHRSGTWEGDPVSTAHPVALTVFIVCGPTYPECHVLRLSRPDQPLA